VARIGTDAITLSNLERNSGEYPIGGDYGATATVSNITEVANFLSETLTIWGVPGESIHDESRG
jgi:hypothetical protein